MDRLYWGILSAGKISNDFMNALSDPTGPAAANNKVVAIAAQQIDRAKMLGEAHGIHTVYGDYQELANNGDIDIIYIGNLNPQHYESCKMMLEAGKHVLCEKPLTTSPEQTRELYDLAKSKNLFLMEALWSNFFPTYKEIKQKIDAGVVGEVLHVEVNFGVNIELVPRINQRDLGGGASFDLGVYCINLVRLVFNREKPQEIIARGDNYQSGVDADWDAILVFKNNRRAVMKCSTRYKLSNTARITGTEGTIELSAPMHCTTSVKFPGNQEFNIELANKPAAKYNFENSAGLAYEAAAVSKAIRAGQLECEEYKKEDSLYIAEIVQEIQRQVGVSLQVVHQ